MGQDYKSNGFDYLAEDRRRLTENVLKVTFLLALTFTFLAKFLLDSQKLSFALFLGGGGLLIIVGYTLLVWCARRHSANIHSQLNALSEEAGIGAVYPHRLYFNLALTFSWVFVFMWVAFCVFKVFMLRTQ